MWRCIHALPVVTCFVLAGVELRQCVALLPLSDIVIIVIPFVDLLACLRIEKQERYKRKH